MAIKFEKGGLRDITMDQINKIDIFVFGVCDECIIFSVHKYLCVYYRTDLYIDELKNIVYYKENFSC